jgi:hypothetical protein
MKKDRVEFKYKKGTQVGMVDDILAGRISYSMSEKPPDQVRAMLIERAGVDCNGKDFVIIRITLS